MNGCLVWILNEKNGISCRHHHRLISINGCVCVSAWALWPSFSCAKAHAIHNDVVNDWLANGSMNKSNIPMIVTRTKKKKNGVYVLWSMCFFLLFYSVCSVSCQRRRRLSHHTKELNCSMQHTHTHTQRDRDTWHSVDWMENLFGLSKLEAVVMSRARPTDEMSMVLNIREFKCSPILNSLCVNFQREENYD